MRNEGRITVFLSLMISVLMMLCVVAFQAVAISAAKEKAVITLRAGISSVKAQYNRYIFDHYHILLFDKTKSGAGEAALEEQLYNDVKENLGDRITIDQLAISDFYMIYDDDLAEFKRQMEESLKYEALSYGVDKIREATGGQDGTLSQSAEADMDRAEEEAREAEDAQVTKESGEEQQTGSTAERLENAGSKQEAEQAIHSLFAEDPRKFSKNMTASGILAVVAPEDMEISNERHEIDGGPSRTVLGINMNLPAAGRDFDDMGEMRSDMRSNSGWDNKLVQGGVTLLYARRMFNSALDTDKNDNTVFRFEMEYLIAGLSSDEDNLKSVVIRLSALRLPVCFGYLITDVKRMTEIRAVTVPLSLLTMIPEPILTYLVAGCWSYAEAICDCRALLHGKRIAFLKNDKNWTTGLHSLASSVFLDVPEDDHGLVYEDYLMILMALNTEQVNYRMLDLMELNAQQKTPEFKMENAAWGLRADAEFGFSGKQFCYSEEGTY